MVQLKHLSYSKEDISSMFVLQCDLGWSHHTTANHVLWLKGLANISLIFLFQA